MFLAAIAVQGKRRNHVHVAWFELILSGRQNDFGMSFGYIIDSCERTGDILPVPVGIVNGQSDVERQWMENINLFHGINYWFK